HDFAGGGAGGPDRIARKDRAVCERQDGGREASLLRQKHWVLRMVTGTPRYQVRRSRADSRCSLLSGIWLECARRTGFTGKPLIIAAGPRFPAPRGHSKTLRGVGRGAGVQADRRRRSDVERLLAARLDNAHRKAGARGDFFADALAFVPQRPGTWPRQLLPVQQFALMRTGCDD